MIDAKKFQEATGRPPEQDDLERCNCDQEGQIGHLCCGWCPDCDMPRFECGHLHPTPRKHDKEDQG